MATVNDVLRRCEIGLSRKFTEAGSPVQFLKENGLLLVKDCYDDITDKVRIPRKSDSTLTSTAGNRTYALPTDIWDGFSGLIDIEYNGIPLIKRTLKDIKEMYGEDWTAPTDLNEPTYYFLEDNEESFSILPTPDKSGHVIKRTYVYEVPSPTSTSTIIPNVFTSFIRYMPLYILGKIYEFERKGPAQQKLVEWEHHLMKRKWNKTKGFGRKSGREAYSKQFQTYRRSY